MNLHDLHELQGAHSYPCLTITLPTHRTFPDNKQDPIRVKNLVNEAASRLRDDLPKRELAQVLKRLEALVSTIDYEHTLDGLLLAVNRDMAREFVLPFSLDERVVVDDTFFTRDLVRAFNRTRRYWVLSLSERDTRLFAATREHLEEMTTGGFPMAHMGPGGAAPLPGGHGVNTSAHRDERHRQFFRAVDAAVAPFMKEDPMPLAVAGVDRYHAFFREASAFGDHIIADIRGNYDHLTPHDLGQHVWPQVAKGFNDQRLQVLDQLGTAVGQHRAVSTLSEVWRQARLGRGAVLVVEDGYHEAGRVNAAGDLDLQVTDPMARDVLDDAVDEVIETVLAKGGRVVFVEDGELATHDQIALILRY